MPIPAAPGHDRRRSGLRRRHRCPNVTGRHAVIRERDGRHYLADAGPAPERCSTASFSTASRAGSTTATRSWSAASRCASSPARNPDRRCAGSAGRRRAGDPPRLGGADDRARPGKRRRARRPQRLPLPRRGRAPRDGAVEVRDLGSRNGTRVDGELVKGRLARAGRRDRDRAVPPRLRRQPLRRARRARRAAARRRGRRRAGPREADPQPRIDRDRARRVRRDHRRERLRARRTLLKALAGRHRPTGGQGHGQRRAGQGTPHRHRLRAAGRDRPPRADRREALRYAARLRLPQDSTRAEIDDAVERVLDELALGEHAETRIGSLSGGQRKRVGRRDRAPQPAEPAVPRRADDRPRSGARDADDGALPRARRAGSRASPSSPTRPRTSTSATRSS